VKNGLLGPALAIGTALVFSSPLFSVAAPATGIQPPVRHFDQVDIGLPNRSAVARPQLAYVRPPLRFEANRGQTDGRVKFLSRGSGSTVFLTSTEAVVVLTEPVANTKRGRSPLARPDLTKPQKVTRTAVRMRLVGASPAPRVTGLEELPGKANYFIGNNPTKWRTNVPMYAKVRYENVYRGIDLVYYGNQRQLEYDFVVAPGADPRVIRLAFEGADKLALDAHGNLVLHTAHGQVLQRAPVIYQEIDGTKREIFGRYVVEGKKRVGFQIAAYDVNRPLIIDPVLMYSTYLGGSDAESAGGIAVDGSGNVYVTGTTRSADFPVASPFQPSLSGSLDVFILKINSTGSLVYSTYLGGSKNDGGPGGADEFGRAVAVDAAGNAYVTGATNSADFPATPGALQPTWAAGCCQNDDAFVVKLNPTGSALVYLRTSAVVSRTSEAVLLWTAAETPTSRASPTLWTSPRQTPFSQHPAV